MRIGELSRRTGVPARLLRYYEEQDLMHPERDSNGYRSYAAAFASAGCDELIFVPTTAAPDQIGLLASAVH